MKDLCFDRFSNPQNLKLAFFYIKREVEKSSLPLDPFWVPGVDAIDRLGDAFFNSLSKILSNGEYQPGVAYFFLQHKENFGVRKIAMINIVDRIVYQALLNKSVLGKAITNTFNDLNFYPRLSKSKYKYLQGYKGFYPRYIKYQKVGNYAGYIWRGEFDVSTFYDNINHQILFDRLRKARVGSQKVLDLLRQILNAWHLDGRGIPQGPDASSVLANFYLTDIDKYFNKIGKLNWWYGRYMDDLVILAKDEKQLYRAIENLTYELNKLDLNLNTKSDVEKVTPDFYEMLSFFDPYNDSGKKDIEYVFGEIKRDIPDLIQRLKNSELRKSVNRRELSKLKYYLKADKTYEFAEDILALYPRLPSYADLISKYILPIAHRAKIRFLILKVITEHHLFRWQIFWLAKIMLLEDIKKEPLFGIDFSSSQYWEIRSIARFVGLLRKKDNLKISEVFNAIKSSENEFEKNLYLGLLGNIRNPARVKTLVRKELKKAPLETRLILLAQSLKEDEINKFAKNGKLFSTEAKNTPKFLPGNKLRFLNGELSHTLGFSYELSPGKEMSVELKNENNKLIITGKILDGKYVGASSSQKSRIVKLIKCLCVEHMGSEKSIFKDYGFKNIVRKYPELRGTGKKIESIVLAREKSDRFVPLLKYCIDMFLEINHTKGGTFYKFRRGIDDLSFQSIPEADQAQIAKYAKITLQKAVKQ